jgi:hypothetical protein
MCKLCWTLLLAAVIAVAVTIFLVAGGDKTTTATDGRQAITLEPQQRDLILAEMRTFVDSLREITQALGSNDSEMFQKAAKKVGLEAQKGVPLDLAKALPLPFKKLGMDTHMKFDTLASHSMEGASNEELLLELSQLMNNCVACHAAYQLQLPAAQAVN